MKKDKEEKYEKGEKGEKHGKCGCPCCKKGEGKRHGMNHYKGKK